MHYISYILQTTNKRSKFAIILAEPWYNPKSFKTFVKIGVSKGIKLLRAIGLPIHGRQSQQHGLACPELGNMTPVTGKNQSDVIVISEWVKAQVDENCL